MESLNFSINITIEKPLYSSSSIDGVSLVDVSQIRFPAGPDYNIPMAFYEPPYTKQGVSSFVLNDRVGQRFYLYDSDDPNPILDCTNLFTLRSDEYLPKEAEFESALDKNPENKTILRQLLIVRAIMKQRGLQTMDEFCKRF